MNMLALRSASTSFHRQAAPALFRLSSTMASRSPNKPNSPSTQSIPVLSGVSRSVVDALTHEKNLLSCKCGYSKTFQEAFELERKLVTCHPEATIVNSSSCSTFEDCVEKAMVFEKEIVTNTSPFQRA
mmetsp:Transcript_31393/g.65042  ORF Transcript_31393/g.65042 Transcript_31393/m.65042 type:complete len:128 (-) Transcript_31393:113-496(-)